MKQKIPYRNFSKFVLRTPLFPYSFLEPILSKQNITEEEFKQICRNPLIQEAIFLASPDLYAELQKWLKNGMTAKPEDKKAQKEIEKLHYALLKYIIRMSSRCTPFGLFAGFSTGKYGEQTTIEFSEQSTYKRHTRLDMNYLCALAQDLAKHPDIKEQINYFTNSSIYAVGDQLRYVEYRYINTKRVHHIVAVDHSEYLQKILQVASKGASINELAQLLVDDEITVEEATEFINEIIDSQLLVNELEPAITGSEFLTQILAILNGINNTENIKAVLSQTESILAQIDRSKIGTGIPKYYEIAEKLKPLETKYELKYLFQTDMVKPVVNCTLNEQIVNDTLKGIEAMNKLTLVPPATNLSQFRDAFYERYEEREMPLLHVLDTEVGIGYKQNQNTGDISPLIDDIVLPGHSGGATDIKWDPVQAFLFKKYNEAISGNKYEIEITDKELEPFQAKWDDLPDTLSTMVNIPENGKIHISAAGGSSSANLLGRFCHADKETHEYVTEITAKEKALTPDAITAEIIHLPESRLGNILLRPVLRDYEIPYLAKSAVAQDFQVDVQDLMISVKRGHIILCSKKLNKEVIPRLSTAHNYSFNALPVYQFLCDMQTQNIRGGVGFNWGSLSNEYAFLPRVKYKNLILSPATWNIKKGDIKEVMNAKDDDTLFEEVKKLREEKNIPALVLLADGDNELLINLENLLCIKTLLSMVKKRPAFKLTEFLFDPDTGVVKSKEGVFTNQFVISFYRH